MVDYYEQALQQVEAYEQLCETCIRVQRERPEGWHRDPRWEEADREIDVGLLQIEAIAERIAPRLADELRMNDAVVMHQRKQDACRKLRGAIAATKEESGMEEDIERARRTLTGLKAALKSIVDRDPEQEVRGMAVPALDAALAQVREVLSDDPVVTVVGGVISVETLAEGEPLRAVDVYLVVTLFLDALPPQQIKASSIL